MVEAEPAYVDTSVFVKLYDSRELGAEEVAKRIRVVRAASSPILLTETQSAFARKFRAGDLVRTDLDRIRRKLKQDWKRVLKVGLTRPVLAEAERLLFLYDLRAAEAIHLASLLVLRRSVPATLPLLSVDGRMAAAAIGEGIAVEHFGLLDI